MTPRTGWPSIPGRPGAQNDDIPELITLARTIEVGGRDRRGGPDRRDERQGRALYRLAKLEARKAYSFRNPASQRRRVRIACTRNSRRATAATKRRSHQATGRQPDPG